MPTIATGLFFLRRHKPLEISRDDKGFHLTLRVVDRQGERQTEPYTLHWRGEAAQVWWHTHGQHCDAGTPVHVEIQNPRAFPGPGGTAPEIHATVNRLQLAKVAPSWERRTSTTATTAHT